MLGGSPMRVAAPPMLEAMTCVSRNGMGSTSSASAITKVTGTMSMTVVTLSRNADRKAVTTASRISILPGLALPHRSEEHTSELQSRQYLVCRLLLEKKKKLNTYC